ncbi:Uncharacterised protein [Mycobacterium xenopi]|nr:Uncharacterised protein [Mycobacterium xenopi]
MMRRFTGSQQAKRSDEVFDLCYPYYSFAYR